MGYQRVGQAAEAATPERQPESSQEKQELSRQTAVSSRAASGGDSNNQANNLSQMTNGRLDRASHTILQLQNQLGNHHVQQLINPTQQITVQPRLMLGDVDTPSEKQAEQVANEVTGGGQASTMPTPVSGGGLPVSPETERSINQARGGGQPLPQSTQAQMGQALGTDLSNVRVHTGEQAHALNQSLQAKAFTTGNDIFFRQGTYNPSSSSGQRLLAHELTHVSQQGTDTPYSSTSFNTQVIQRFKLSYDEVIDEEVPIPAGKREAHKIKKLNEWKITKIQAMDQYLERHSDDSENREDKNYIDFKKWVSGYLIAYNFYKNIVENEENFEKFEEKGIVNTLKEFQHIAKEKSNLKMGASLTAIQKRVKNEFVTHNKTVFDIAVKDELQNGASTEIYTVDQEWDIVLKNEYARFWTQLYAWPIDLTQKVRTQLAEKTASTRYSAILQERMLGWIDKFLQKYQYIDKIRKSYLLDDFHLLHKDMHVEQAKKEEIIITEQDEDDFRGIFETIEPKNNKLARAKKKNISDVENKLDKSWEQIKQSGDTNAINQRVLMAKPIIPRELIAEFLQKYPTFLKSEDSKPLKNHTDLIKHYKVGADPYGWQISVKNRTLEPMINFKDVNYRSRLNKHLKVWRGDGRAPYHGFPIGMPGYVPTKDDEGYQPHNQSEPEIFDVGFTAFGKNTNVLWHANGSTSDNNSVPNRTTNYVSTTHSTTKGHEFASNNRGYLYRLQLTSEDEAIYLNNTLGNFSPYKEEKEVSVRNRIAPEAILEIYHHSNLSKPMYSEQEIEQGINNVRNWKKGQKIINEIISEPSGQSEDKNDRVPKTVSNLKGKVNQIGKPANEEKSSSIVRKPTSFTIPKLENPKKKTKHYIFELDDKYLNSQSDTYLDYLYTYVGGLLPSAWDDQEASEFIDLRQRISAILRLRKTKYNASKRAKLNAERKQKRQWKNEQLDNAIYYSNSPQEWIENAPYIRNMLGFGDRKYEITQTPLGPVYRKELNKSVKWTAHGPEYKDLPNEESDLDDEFALDAGLSMLDEIEMLTSVLASNDESIEEMHALPLKAKQDKVSINDFHELESRIAKKGQVTDSDKSADNVPKKAKGADSTASAWVNNNSANKHFNPNESKDYDPNVVWPGKVFLLWDGRRARALKVLAANEDIPKGINMRNRGSNQVALSLLNKVICVSTEGNAWYLVEPHRIVQGS